MTPSFLEHWAQRVFGGFGASESVAAFGGLEQSVVTFGDSDIKGVVIMIVYWLGSTITAHQFFNTITYPSPFTYFTC